jgi:hypothetical protein
MMPSAAECSKHEMDRTFGSDSFSSGLPRRMVKNWHSVTCATLRDCAELLTQSQTSWSTQPALGHAESITSNCPGYGFSRW